MKRNFYFKRLSVLSLVFVFLTAFTCDNDDSDDNNQEEEMEIIEEEDPSLLGTWKMSYLYTHTVIETTTQSTTDVINIYIANKECDYFLTFEDENSYSYEGDQTSNILTVYSDGSTNMSSNDITDAQGNGSYSVDGNDMVFQGDLTNPDNDIDEILTTYEFRSNGQLLDITYTYVQTVSEGSIQSIATTSSRIALQRIGEEASTCTNAIIMALQNKADLDLALADDYEQFCSAYVAALNDQIVICGDEDGFVQTQIDSIGDCSYQQNLNCNQLEALTQTAFLNYQDANASNYAALCNAYRDALQDQINFCGDASGALQLLLDALGSCQTSNSESYVKLVIDNAVRTFVFSPTNSDIDGNVYFNFCFENGSNSPYVYLSGNLNVYNQTGLVTIIYRQADGTEYFNYTQNFPFTSNLIQNDSDGLKGTIYGVLQDEFNNALQLPLGIININY